MLPPHALVSLLVAVASLWLCVEATMSIHNPFSQATGVSRNQLELSNRRQRASILAATDPDQVPPPSKKLTFRRQRVSPTYPVRIPPPSKNGPYLKHLRSRKDPKKTFTVQPVSSPQEGEESPAVDTDANNILPLLIRPQKPLADSQVDSVGVASAGIPERSKPSLVERLLPYLRQERAEKSTQNWNKFAPVFGIPTVQTNPMAFAKLLHQLSSKWVGLQRMGDEGFLHWSLLQTIRWLRRVPTNERSAYPCVMILGYWVRFRRQIPPHVFAQLVSRLHAFLEKATRQQPPSPRTVEQLLKIFVELKSSVKRSDSEEYLETWIGWLVPNLVEWLAQLDGTPLLSWEIACILRSLRKLESELTALNVERQTYFRIALMNWLLRSLESVQQQPNPTAIAVLVRSFRKFKFLRDDPEMYSKACHALALWLCRWLPNTSQPNTRDVANILLGAGKLVYDQNVAVEVREVIFLWIRTWLLRLTDPPEMFDMGNLLHGLVLLGFQNNSLNAIVLEWIGRWMSHFPPSHDRQATRVVTALARLMSGDEEHQRKLVSVLASWWLSEELHQPLGIPTEKTSPEDRHVNTLVHASMQFAGKHRDVAVLVDSLYARRLLDSVASTQRRLETLFAVVQSPSCSEIALVLDLVRKISLLAPFPLALEKSIVEWAEEVLPLCPFPTVYEASVIVHALSKSLRQTSVSSQLFDFWAGSWFSGFETYGNSADGPLSAKEVQYFTQLVLGFGNLIHRDRQWTLKEYGDIVRPWIVKNMQRIGLPSEKLLDPEIVFAIYRTLQFWDIDEPRELVRPWLDLGRMFQIAGRSVRDGAVSYWEHDVEYAILQFLEHNGFLQAYTETQFKYYGYVIDVVVHVQLPNGHLLSIAVDCNGNQYHAAQEPVREFALTHETMRHLKLWWNEWDESARQLPERFQVELLGLLRNEVDTGRV